MLTITAADHALAAGLGLTLVQDPSVDRDLMFAADPRAARLPQSWQVLDARCRLVGWLRFTAVDRLYVTKVAVGVTWQEETVAEAPELRHVRTGKYAGTRTIVDRGQAREVPRATTSCGAESTGADYAPIAARVELREGRAQEMCLSCRAKLEQAGGRDLSHLSGGRGSATVKQRSFIRHLLDEAARSGRPHLMDARGVDELSSREARAKIDELKEIKARGWK